jgi:hypothetical protein
LPEGILADVVLDGFVRALDGYEAVLAGVAPGYWSAPSPCAGWSAADVAGHVIGDLRATEAMARGRYEETEASDPGSAAGDDPLAAWGVARATGQVAVLDPGLVHDALGPARQFAPLARLSGLVGPECAVPEDADDLTRLLAIFGRPDTSSKRSLRPRASYRIFTVGRPSVPPQAMQRRRRDQLAH